MPVIRDRGEQIRGWARGDGSYLCRGRSIMPEKLRHASHHGEVSGLYEKYSDKMREASRQTRVFAHRRGDDINHTGHLLYAIVATNAWEEVPELPTGEEAPGQLEQCLDEGVPPDLVRQDLGRSGISDAFAVAVEMAIRRCRERGPETVTAADVVWGVLSSEPNAATYLLKHLGVDCGVLRELLRDDTREDEPG